mmetsp:Transcript_15985/g.11531  ORF Transcript_15985/g.11531 Transcript_15985/m.11531 type:complete len:322 (-) Transcript_15985:42-1007(-)
MLYGTVPFKANNMSELQKQITKGQPAYKDGEISPESQQLIKAILEKEPSKRLTLTEILSHKWMKATTDDVVVFTEQEKEKIASEFAYYNINNNNGHGGSNEVVHTDPFTEQMLNSTENSLVRNISTKSVILAPFNSTRSHIDEGQHLRRSVQDLVIDKQYLKFAPKVKEINRQYEQNNNAELDNGVYHQDDEEEEKKANSLETSFDKNEQVDLLNDPEEDKLQSEIEEGQRKKKQSEWQKIEQQIVDDQRTESEARCDTDLEDSITHAGLQRVQTLVINDKLVAEIERTGYPRSYIVQSLNNDELSYVTAFYYLLCTNKEF